MARVWNKDLDARLEALYPDVGAKGAAEALGLNVRQVINRACFLGIKSGRAKKYSVSFCLEILSCRDTMTIKETAEKFGLTRNQVVGICQRGRRHIANPINA